MTLEEAIKHCEEKAKELRADYEDYKSIKEKYGTSYYREVPIIPTECLECAKEHEQLAEWLKELKTAREELTEWHKLRLICASEGIIVYKVKENE